MTKGVRTISSLQAYCGPHKHDICKLLAISESRLSELILQGGLEYLADLPFPQCAAYAHNAGFWSWFKLYWYSLDAEYINTPITDHQSVTDHYVRHHLQKLSGVLPAIPVLRKMMKNQHA